MNKAVFIDKDGTLIRDIPFNVDPTLIMLNDGAIECLGLLREAGFRIILVSNQSGVARGLFPTEALRKVSRRLRTITGGMVSAFYYCTHGELDGCACRKPGPGLLLQAASEHNICLTGSWMVGDILHDVEAGNRAGVRSVLLDPGGETDWLVNRLRVPFAICPDLRSATRIILNPSSCSPLYSS